MAKHGRNTSSSSNQNKYDPATVVFWRTHPPSFWEPSDIHTYIKLR